MDSLRKSFKSRSPNPSFDYDHQEEQPILFDHGAGDDNNHDRHQPLPSSDDRREVVVKIDGNSRDPSPNSSIWKEPSYDFWKDNPTTNTAHSDNAYTNVGGSALAFSFLSNQSPQHLQQQQQQRAMREMGQDPPSRLMSSLNKQRASDAQMSLNMDLETKDLNKPPMSNSASKELRVCFQDPSADSPSSSSSDDGRSARRRTRPLQGDAEVLRCTSNASFRPASSLLRAKTRSRLMDPPPPVTASGALDDERRSGGRPPTRSGQLKSGLLGGKPQHDEDDDDPFVDDDIPDDFKRAKFDTLTIIQWVSLVLILAALACSLSVTRLQRQTVWSLHLWKWEVLVLVLICGRLVSGWCIRIAVFFIERNFLLRKRVLYFVYGVRKAVQNCLWLGFVLLAWELMFDKKVERDTKSKTLLYVTKVLFCLLIATLLRLVKTLLVKVLASSFHVSTYFDRIQESLFNQFVIETLSGPPLVEIQNTREEEDRMMADIQKLQNAGATIPQDLREAALPSKSGGAIRGSKRGGPGQQRSAQIGAKSVRFAGAVSRRDFSRQMQQPVDEGITIEDLHKLNQKNISAWNMKRLMRIVRQGMLTTLHEQITQDGSEDESAMQIRSEYEAKIAARNIFNNVAKPGSKYIYLTDLMRFMRDDEALKTMSLFEGAQENRRVSRRSLQNWVINAFRERKALSLTLNDTKTAVNKLHQMANVVVGIIVLGLWLLILGLATTHFFVLIGSQALVAVFMFGNTLKMIFEAIIFLFVMHPFDVGDRCEIDGVQMIVEEMNILATVFLRYDNQKVIYPNSVLSTLPISNIYRSPDMGDSIDFCVHVSTPVEKLVIMKERIKAFIASKVEHWHPTPSVVLRDVDDLNRLKVSVWLCHRINFQDMGQRWVRRELVLQEMIKVLRELDIEYRMLPLDVNVRDMPALTSTRLPSSWTTCS